MFSQKLYNASFAAFSLLFIAATSNHPNSANQFNTVVKDTCIADSLYLEGHRFDSTGLCSCLSFLPEEKLEEAPRIILHKRAESFVSDYLKKNRTDLPRLKAKSDPYFKIINKAFSSYDIPEELRYLAVIESRLNPKAVSKAGAVGLWQFMRPSAKTFGLKTSGSDERKDVYKSSYAAARYLKYLHKMFDDWLLAIAAYNSGPGHVLSAIKKSGSRDFWALEGFLPIETRAHVKKFIAVHYYFEGHGSLATMTKKETTAHIKKVNELLMLKQEIAKEDTLLVLQINPVEIITKN
jgi:membrane-bound lytic murein transglycosylase D